VRGAGKHRRPHRHFGRPPKAPGAIAPEYLSLFENIAHPRKRAYLAAYVQERGGQVRTRKTAGGGSSHFRWLRDDPDYRAAFRRARLAVADAIEREIYRRAVAAPSTDGQIMSVVARLRREGYGEGRRSGKKVEGG